MLGLGPGLGFLYRKVVLHEFQDIQDGEAFVETLRNGGQVVVVQVQLPKLRERRQNLKRSDVVSRRIQLLCACKC